MTEIMNMNKARELLKTLDEAYADIPFGNSAFQTEMFVIASQITPERAYRQIGMQLSQVLQSLATSALELKKCEAEILELKSKLDSETTTSKIIEIDMNIFSKEREQISLRKSLSDQTVEATLLHEKFETYPRYTREEFEAGERMHYEQRLTRQILGCDGPKEALLNMNDDVRSLKLFIESYLALPAEESKMRLGELARKSIISYVEPPMLGERK